MHKPERLVFPHTASALQDLPARLSDREAILGKKATRLLEMTKLGVPVPPAFTISTEVCSYYTKFVEICGNEHPDRFPAGLDEELQTALRELEGSCDRRLGEPGRPLLLAVRSSACCSMPGMLDSILNIGINHETVAGLGQGFGERLFAWEAYLRLIFDYGTLVLGMDASLCQDLLEQHAKEFGKERTMPQCVHLVERLQDLLRKHSGGQSFPEDPESQLSGAIEAVLSSLSNERSLVYRRLHPSSIALKTAVNIQAMAFGNMAANSCAGVAYSRDPLTGDRRHCGEFLKHAQGSDLNSGQALPLPLAELVDFLPACAAELDDVLDALEDAFKAAQYLEFTIEEGKLFILEASPIKSTAAGSLRMASQMVMEGKLSCEEALLDLDVGQLRQLGRPVFALEDLPDALAHGVPAAPGCIVGHAATSRQEATDFEKAGREVILLCETFTSEELAGLAIAKGIIAGGGGLSSHAASMARQLGKACVAGCTSLSVDPENGSFSLGGREFRAGEVLSIDGGSGAIYEGQVVRCQAKDLEELETVMAWADKRRRLGIRSDISSLEEARRAMALGADGIGLLRTESMFVGPEALCFLRIMLSCDHEDERLDARRMLLLLQVETLVPIFKFMHARPVNVRLFDLPAAQLEQRHCRFGRHMPEFYVMQMQAIIESAYIAAQQGCEPRLQLCVPRVATLGELAWLENRLEELLEARLEKGDHSIAIEIGASIVTPRAALLAQELAVDAKFFLIETDELSELCSGVSRRDRDSYLPLYHGLGLNEQDPFRVLDRQGVGSLLETALHEGRRRRAGLRILVTGEAVCEADSVRFLDEIACDDLCCKAEDIPAARVAAAQSAILAKRTSQAVPKAASPLA